MPVCRWLSGGRGRLQLTCMNSALAPQVFDSSAARGPKRAPTAGPHSRAAKHQNLHGPLALLPDRRIPPGGAKAIRVNLDVTPSVGSADPVDVGAPVYIATVILAKILTGPRGLVIAVRKSALIFI